MQCPRLHGELEPIFLNADIASSMVAHLCPDCHGIWIRPAECLAFLGLDCKKLLHRSKHALIDLPCAGCGANFRSVEYALENGDSFWFHICPHCQACFFDGFQFSMVFYAQLKTERVVSGILAETPLDDLGTTCCDCGCAIHNLDEIYDAGTGFCCQGCHYNPPILSENKIQTVQLVTFHGMEIKIDHWQLSTRSRIAVTPVEPCRLEARLFSLSPVQRVCRLGRRKIAFHGELGRHVDGTEDIQFRTPWQLFLRQRGITDCLLELHRLGMIEVTFKPHNIIFELNANRAGTDTKLKFEALTRRIILAYEKYVELTHRYVQPEDEE